jgi:hypothetical protein
VIKGFSSLILTFSPREKGRSINPLSLWERARVRAAIFNADFNITMVNYRSRK